MKEVQQHGQIFVEGSLKQEGKILLVNEAMWKNSKVVSKRITPNSLPCKMISDLEYKFETTEGYKSKPIIDYVLRTETFSQEKIPLFFIYTMEVNSSNISLIFSLETPVWRLRQVIGIVV